MAIDYGGMEITGMWIDECVEFTDEDYEKLHELLQRTKGSSGSMQLNKRPMLTIVHRPRKPKGHDKDAL